MKKDKQQRLARRVALIGHSGSGKSTCLRVLGLDCRKTDMDSTFHSRCPSLEEALAWLVSPDRDASVVAVSNHEEMLRSMVRTKQTKEGAEQFELVHLVYLHVSRALLPKRLENDRRDADAVSYTISHYDRFDLEIYRQLADEVVRCDSMTADHVAQRIRGIVASRIGAGFSWWLTPSGYRALV